MPRDPIYGHVPGIAGSTFADVESWRLWRSPPVAGGICGRANDGAESVVLNGGYAG